MCNLLSESSKSNQSLRGWNEALKLAHLRNQVAHNPIIFGWSQVLEAGEPNALGIPNIRARRASIAKWLLSTEHADKSINSMVEIATTLAELRTEWCAARGQGHVPPVRAAPLLWYRYRFRRRIGMAMYNLQESPRWPKHLSEHSPAASCACRVPPQLHRSCGRLPQRL